MILIGDLPFPKWREKRKGLGLAGGSGGKGLAGVDGGRWQLVCKNKKMNKNDYEKEGRVIIIKITRNSRKDEQRSATIIDFMC